MVRASCRAAVSGVAEVSTAGGSWAEACHRVVRWLQEDGVGQGQVVWVDLHSAGHGVEAPAKVVSAYCSKQLPSRGALDLQFELIEANDVTEGGDHSDVWGLRER